MKNNLRIGAGLLAMYILSLPLALVFHAQGHTDKGSTNGPTEFADFSVEEDSDCQLCSFYFDQQLYLESTPVPLVDASFTHFHQRLTETERAVSSEPCFLRGPPTV